MPSLGPQNTCGPVGQTPMNPRVPCKGCRAGPVFDGWDEDHTALPDCPPVILLMKGGPPSLVCQSRGTVLDRHAMLKRHVNHDSPTTSRDLRYSGQILPVELFNHLGDINLGDESVQPRVPGLCFHQGMRDGRITESPGGALCSTPNRDAKKARYSALPLGL
ncbi:hypothetical protein AMECASPLE_021940 [Ameca splendens]|uniref:Uncharacterized protein n=1 Tax=Ameca splendens TaxID=208324 RepID=A0ABV1ACM8_9TELE